MNFTEPAQPPSRYPVVATSEAQDRIATVMGEVGLATDVGLDDRLDAVLRRWLDEAGARDLANETQHLYRLLTKADRSTPDKPVDPTALRRALLLAMTRPAEDPCWRDYQAVLASIETYHQTVESAYRVGPALRLRRALTRWRPDQTDAEAWARPIIDARKHFVANWRT